MATLILPAHHPEAIQAALEALSKDELIAFPTDTVYGLGAFATHIWAIEKLYQVKERERAKGIPILIGAIEDLEQVAIEIDDWVEQLVQRFWPGALTLVLKRHPKLPANLAPQKTIGVRMPNHPLTLELLRSAGPLAVTSANLSGKPESNSAEEVQAQLEGRIRIILDGGRTSGGLPSTVLDCTTFPPQVLRQGPISANEIKRVLHIKDM